MPRFFILVKASPLGEDHHGPDPSAMFEAMGKFNARLTAAGVLLSGDGLLPSAKDGYRVHFSSSSEDNSNNKPATTTTRVEKGPFDASVTSGDLVSGWWILKTKDADEALEWAKQIPFKEGHVEVRRVAELEDMSEFMTEEMMAEERKLREVLEAKKGGA